MRLFGELVRGVHMDVFGHGAQTSAGAPTLAYWLWSPQRSREEAAWCHSTEMRRPVGSQSYSSSSDWIVICSGEDENGAGKRLSLYGSQVAARAPARPA